MEAKRARSLPDSIMDTSNKRPKGTGRKKIEIKKIENNSSRKVAFSKRRKGMFKKAGELCRLSNAEIAIIVFSPKGRLFSYGDHVIDRFLAENGDEIIIDGRSSSKEEGFWWEQSIEKMDLEEIEKYKTCLEELRYNVSLRAEEMVSRRTSERDFLGVTEET